MFDPDHGALDSDSDEGPNPLVMPVEDLSGDEYFAAQAIDELSSSNQHPWNEVKVHVHICGSVTLTLVLGYGRTATYCEKIHVAVCRCTLM